MTKNDKELLLKDLHAKLPYGVLFKDEDDENLQEIHYIKDEEIYTKAYPHLPYWIENIKPYLRPISSMTDEEKQLSRWYQKDAKNDNFILYMCQYEEWLDSKHFDWRTDDNGKTLIEKGLALEAPKDMYNLKEK